MARPEHETYGLGDWQLQCGSTLKDAHVAYRTFGNPKSPAIVYPTWFSGGLLPRPSVQAFISDQ